MEEAKQRAARELHYQLANELDDQLKPIQPEYNKVKQAVRTYLGDGELAKCQDIIDVFNKLDMKRVIRAGEYAVLKRIFDKAGLVRLSEIVNDRENEINRLLGQNVEQNKSNIAEPLTSGETSTDNLGNPERTSDPKLLCILEKSERWQRTCKSSLSVFVKTRAYIDTKEQIHEKDSVVLLAGPGDGKSFILQQISVDLAEEGYLTVYLQYPDDIESNYIHGRKLLFIFDDAFGGPCLLQNQVNLWLKKNDLFFQQFTNEGNVKFLFSSRSLIWSECKHSLTTIKLFQNILDACSKKLSTDEKKMMLENHLAANRTMSTYTIHRICHLESVAFPESCRRLAMTKDGTTEDDILRMFANPFNFLCEQIQTLCERGAVEETEMWKFLTLVLAEVHKSRSQQH